VIYETPEIRSSSTIFLDKLPVSITTKIPGAAVHFTTNGEEPSIHSTGVKGILMLTNSATIKAKCFLGTKAISETAIARFEKVIPAAAMKSMPSGPGLNFSEYEGKWSMLPAFDSMKAAARGVANNFDISSKKGSDYYGFVFNGLIKIPTDGIFTFYISSDDGSQLFINDKLLVDNDGLHGMLEKENQAPLAKGYHRIKVLFFEKSGDDDLQLQWKGAGFKKQVIPASVLSRE
jgi:alpha-L-fucosidase